MESHPFLLFHLYRIMLHILGGNNVEYSRSYRLDDTRPVNYYLSTSSQQRIVLVLVVVVVQVGM